MELSNKISITNEDCMALMKRYPDKYFDLAIVDPVYGIDGNSHRKNLSRGKLTLSKEYDNSLWDQPITPREYFDELFRVSQHQIIWGINYFVSVHKLDIGAGRIVWDKVNGDTTFSDAEIAYSSLHYSVRILPFMWSGMMQGVSFRKGRIMQGDKKLNEKRIHPTQKPVEVYKWLLDRYAHGEHKILDTHMGSGSIAIACHEMGISLTACELVPKYYQEAIQRIKSHMSQTVLF